MKKKLLSLLLCGLLAATTVSFAACKKAVPDTEDYLQIFCTDAGYGTQWCVDMIEAFKEEDWVKEKYPNLQIPAPTLNDNQSYASNQLSSGAKVNTYDLLFGMKCNDFAGPNGQLLDLTDVLYNSTVPGENVTYKEKMNDSYVDSNRYIDVTGALDDSYYMTSWAGGMNSIIYNASIFEEKGYAVPNTTKELEALCAKYKQDTNGGGYCFIQSNGDDYWMYLFPIWWAQYEGIDNYLDFWNGISGGRYSTDIFNQMGRQYSLGVYQDLLAYSKAYVDLQSAVQGFMPVQTMFLQGQALMHVNGDWFSSEMQTMMDSIKAQGGVVPELKTMRLPIISALGTKLGITDEELSAAVSYVDKTAGGESVEKPALNSSKNITTDEVISTVREARGIVHSVGTGHTAVIPSYATAKNAAVDFLRFMATDKGLEIYMRATGGAALPFDFDLSDSLYNELTSLHKSKMDYFQSSLDIYTLPSDTIFPLARFGDLKPFVNARYYSNFTAQNVAKTPEDYMKETKDAWTDKKFADALNAAGLS